MTNIIIHTPGTVIEGNVQNAFIALYCETDVYRNYDQVSEEDRKMIVPLLLMLDRWDGVRGFPGGRMEDGESVREAAIRELEEELNYRLSDDEIIEEKLVSTHEISRSKGPNFTTNLIAIRVSEDTLRAVMKSFTGAEHFLAETMGVTAHPVINYSYKAAFDNFINSSFAPTVKEELVDLFQNIGWDKKYGLVVPL